MAKSNQKKVESVHPQWKNRPMSNLVRWCMAQSETHMYDVAEALDICPDYLHNKITHNLFSFDELLIIAKVCGYSFVLSRDSDDENWCRSRQMVIDPVIYFDGYDEEALQRVKNIISDIS